MEDAFADVFAQGYKRVVIIGSDCFDLTTAIVETAFQLLHTSKVVVGPARDGGYYLHGLKNGLKKVFDDISWSTANVWPQTEKKMKRQNIAYALLPL